MCNVSYTYQEWMHVYSITFIFPEFPTNRTELNAVFDIFDRDRSGELDYKEFVDALRPERQVSVDILYHAEKEITCR